MEKKKTFSENETYADRLAWHSCRGSGGGVGEGYCSLADRWKGVRMREREKEREGSHFNSPVSTSSTFSTANFFLLE
jgi:hypothetical protein